MLCTPLYPFERSLKKRFDGKPFALVGVNSDADRSQLKTVMQEQAITWTSFWEGGNGHGLTPETKWGQGGKGPPISAAWQLTLRPTVYILDSQGVIRYKGFIGKIYSHQGKAPEDAMEKGVDQLLQELEANQGP